MSARSTLLATIGALCISGGPALAADPKALPGDWAGILQIGSEVTPIRLQFRTEGAGLKATADLPAEEAFALPVEGLKYDSASFWGDLPTAWGKLGLYGHLKGGSISGTVHSGDRIGAIRFSRLAAVDAKTLAQYEGVYALGTNSLLVERLWDYLTCLDARAGSVRVLYPIAESTFIAGSTLASSMPPEKEITFVRDSHGKVSGLCGDA